jgi:hypothetical protein
MEKKNRGEGKPAAFFHATHANSGRNFVRIASHLVTAANHI